MGPEHRLTSRAAPRDERGAPRPGDRRGAERGVLRSPRGAAHDVARGFTFVEIMIVLAIIAIGAALAIPALDAGMDAREVRRAVRQIAATMNYCRTEAVATGKMRHLRIKPDENAIETDDRSRWAILTERARIERADGGAISGDGTVDIIFYPNGATSGADIVVVSRRDRSANRLRLLLDPLVGSTRVEDAG